MTLNTFHMAGVASKNVTLGVPRLREVINIAKTIKTPSLRIFLDKVEDVDDVNPTYTQLKNAGRAEEAMEELARQVGNQIEYTNLSHVVAKSAIYYDPDPKHTVIKADQELLDLYIDTIAAFQDENRYNQNIERQSHWILRFELDSDKINEKDISLELIERRILEEVSQDDDTPIDIIRNHDHEDLSKMVMRLRFPKFGDDTDDINEAMMLRQVESHIVNMLTIKGIREITKVSYTKEAAQCKIDVFDPVTGKHSKDTKNVIIETDGVALKQVLAVDHVDVVKTTSNDIIEILKTLGIEATKQSLIAELRFVLGSYGIYVNYRHLSTLCDIMTTRGILTPITRHGINRVDSGALRKCSFEETVEILLESSFHAEVDPLAGVTENIIMGQLAPYGTGSFDLMMNC